MELEVWKYEIGMFDSDSILEKIDSFGRRIGILNRFFGIRFLLKSILNGQNRNRNGSAMRFQILKVMNFFFQEFAYTCKNRFQKPYYNYYNFWKSVSNNFHTVFFKNFIRVSCIWKMFLKIIINFYNSFFKKPYKNVFENYYKFLKRFFKNLYGFSVFYNVF